MHLHFHVERLQMSYVQNLMFNYNYEYDVHKVTTRKNRRSIYIYNYIYILCHISKHTYVCKVCVYICCCHSIHVSQGRCIRIHIGSIPTDRNLFGLTSDGVKVSFRCGQEAGGKEPGGSYLACFQFRYIYIHLDL
jgi:hypothetical protein